MDCLVDAGVIKDDCQICAVQMEKIYGEEPNTTIMLKEAWRDGNISI
jgi:Holliday junction resolvase RusA-like endonuclease